MVTVPPRSASKGVPMARSSVGPPVNRPAAIAKLKPVADGFVGATPRDSCVKRRLPCADNPVSEPLRTMRRRRRRRWC